MFEKFIELLASLPTNAALRVEGQRLLRRVEELEKEVTQMKAVIADQERQLAEFAAKEKFVKFRGVFWERDDSGGYVADPICPVCRVTLWQTEDFLPFCCSSCKFKSLFLKGDLVSVFAELNHKTNPE